MYNFSINTGGKSVTIIGVKSKGVGGSVVIPTALGGLPVTAIGDKAFDNCRFLEGITLPSSVTSIGVEAFGGCLSLTSVTIEEGDICIVFRGTLTTSTALAERAVGLFHAHLKSWSSRFPEKAEGR